MGLYTPTIVGGNSYLSWFYDRGAINDPTHTGTSKGLSQAINRGPIRKFLPKYAKIYVTIQSHGFSAGARTHYVTANGVRNGLTPGLPPDNRPSSWRPASRNAGSCRAPHESGTLVSTREDPAHTYIACDGLRKGSLIPEEVAE